ncbi:MAG: hypothetical protein LBD41_07925 [Clostridiales Family XIII bacterium]|jgi:hypothetical protein|nr:hypothetical protein [Clostridiales Family XIII bacterium]
MDHFKETFPFIAQALSKNYGIRGSIIGNIAFTNTGDIYIPSLPLDAPELTVRLARAYIDHESAHIALSNFDIDRIKKRASVS